MPDKSVKHSLSVDLGPLLSVFEQDILAWANFPFTEPCHLSSPKPNKWTHGMSKAPTFLGSGIWNGNATFTNIKWWALSFCSMFCPFNILWLDSYSWGRRLWQPLSLSFLFQLDTKALHLREVPMERAPHSPTHGLCGNLVFFLFLSIPFLFLYSAVFF